MASVFPFENWESEGAVQAAREGKRGLNTGGDTERVLMAEEEFSTQLVVERDLQAEESGGQT